VTITIKGPGEIRELLAQACVRRELLILATPYLRFESSFVALEENELHVLATMSRDDAAFGLKTSDLKMRFPQGLGFFESSVQMLGLGLHDGRRTVRLSIPKSVQENDQRVAYRVERLGKVEVTFSTPKADIFTATLLDLSTSGARLHTHVDLPGGAMYAGDRILVSIPLNPDIRIQASAVVRHMRGRSVGLQYQPDLGAEVLEPLSRWVFLGREEERERLARRLEQAVRPEPPGNGIPELSILLISADPDLERDLREALAGVRPLTRLAPAAQPLKDALATRPSLAIFHVGGTGLDERRRLKTLLEIAQRKVPTLLLGTEVDGATLFELASEWKASSAMSWHPGRGPFLERLVRGMIRRHMDTGEGPMAPLEAGEP
jgi:hypothetical protein